MDNFLSNYNTLVEEILRTRTDITTESRDWYLPRWVKWYSGYVGDFHRHYIYNGTRHIYREKKHLNMAKRVCEDWASLLVSEKVKINVGNNNDEFQKILDDLKLMVRLNRCTELGFALGYAALVVDIDGIEYNSESGVVRPNKNTKLNLSYYRATQVIPITFANKEITECAFVNETKKTLSINAHCLDNEGVYHIYMYRKDKESGGEKVFDFNTRYNKPLFSIISPNIENNLILGSQYPISVFANAIDQLEVIDEKYDTNYIEFKNGKKRVFVSSALEQVIITKDKDGNDVSRKVNAFDENDFSIYVVPQGEDEKNLISTGENTLRTNEINQGIYMEMSLLSYKVGLGANYYTFDATGGVQTATAVISEKSDCFRNKKKHEQLLKPAIVNICEALIYCNNNFTLNPKIGENQEIKILFDDSIIEDKKAEQERDMANVNNGVMSKWEYRMKWFAEDEETAKANVYAINGRDELLTRARNVSASFMGRELPSKAYVNLVFEDEDLAKMQMSRDEMIAYYDGKSAEDNEIGEEDLDATGGYNPKNAKEGQEPTNEEEDSDNNEE